MTQIHETAYPRIRSKLTEKELEEIYTPTQEEIAFAQKCTRAPAPQLRLLVLLKTFQRLGYFPNQGDIPLSVIEHISIKTSIEAKTALFEDYATKKSRWKHAPLIRSYLNIKSFSDGGHQVMKSAMLSASRTKDVIADIINAGIEDLVRQHFELPAFSTMRRAARNARSATNRALYEQVAGNLSTAERATISALLTRVEGKTKSRWNRLKEEPDLPSTKNMREYLDHLQWMQAFKIDSTTFERIPESKKDRFAEEAKASDLGNMNKMAATKRFTVAAAFIININAKVLDDLAEMFIRSMQSIHNKGLGCLEQYRAKHQDRTDALVERLRRIAALWKNESEPHNLLEGIDLIIGGDVTEILKQCDEHLVYAANNAIPFYLSPYKSRRSNLFRFLESVHLKSTTSDKTMEKAIAFLLDIRRLKKDRIAVVNGAISLQPSLDLSWIPERWWKIVTGTSRRDAEVFSVDRRYFELCVFSCVILALKSGDLFIEGSKKYNDYRKQLISWQEYRDSVALYCKQVGLSQPTKAFVQKLRSSMESAVREVDDSFPDNDAVSVKNGVSFRQACVRRKPRRGNV